jgi:uncharacterized RDD family membrane protein YckC
MAETPTPREPEYVGFWMRFLAFLVDSLVALVILSPIMLALYGGGYFGKLAAEWAALSASTGDPYAMINALQALNRPDSASSALTDIRVGIGFAITVILFWRFRGATPGKMLVGAKIVTADTLAQPSTGRLIGRYLAYFVSIFSGFIGFLWIAFDRRKQAWHDKLAGTVVVRTREET